MKISRFYIVPIAAVLIGFYLLGLSFWQNRYCEIKAPQSLAATAMPTETGQGKNSASPKAVTRSEEEENAVLKNISDRININTATPSELESLDGIGPVLAERIIERREALGGFRSTRQLLDIHGIGEDIFARIQAYITTE